MTTVWKYELDTANEVEHALPLPGGAVVVHVGESDGKLALWALADPAAPTVERRFRVYATGEGIPHRELGLDYVASAVVAGGLRVWHVFEVVREGDPESYLDVEAFYDGRPERRTSGEVDFGVFWREQADVAWPQWRLSWVEKTGEVYAVRLGQVRSDPWQHPVIVLGIRGTRDAVEEALLGWEKQEPATLGWARERVKGGR